MAAQPMFGMVMRVSAGLLMGWLKEVSHPSHKFAITEQVIQICQP